MILISYFQLIIEIMEELKIIEDLNIFPKIISQIIYCYSSGNIYLFEKKFDITHDIGNYLDNITGITVFKDRIYVINKYNDKIEVFDLNGARLFIFGDHFLREHNLCRPNSIIILNEDLYVSTGSVVIIFDFNGNYKRLFNLKRQFYGIEKMNDTEFFAISTYKSAIYKFKHEELTYKKIFYKIVNRQLICINNNIDVFYHSICVVNSKIYFSDTKKDEIRIFDEYGKLVKTWIDFKIKKPKCLILHNNEFYVCCENCVHIFDINYNYLRSIIVDYAIRILCIVAHNDKLYIGCSNDYVYIFKKIIFNYL